MNLPAAVQAPGTSAAPLPTAGASAPALAPEVGNSEWGKALGQQVVQMGTAGHQVAELQLNPPGLGPLKITLSMNDHQLQAMFVVGACIGQGCGGSGPAAIARHAGRERAQPWQHLGGRRNTAADRVFQRARPPARTRKLLPAAEMADTAAAFALRNAAEPVRTLGGLRIDTYA